MEPPTHDDMVVAALVIGAALVAFIVVLYLNREGKEKVAKSNVAGVDATEGGTVLVEEQGRVVRRSTRQQKHATDELYPKSPSVPKTPRSARADGYGSTPATTARTPRTSERTASPARGRAKTAKSPAAPKSRAGKSPAPAATPASPLTTPRTRGRPARA